MNIELHEFQLKAVRKLLYELKEARREFELEGMRQALALSAPTGSGKTVIMSALIEAVLDRGHPDGEASEFPDDQASFLWITDQPQLNIQTIYRMQSHFDRIWFGGGIEEINDSFDREQLEPRKLYFINTQKLGKKGLLVKQGDGRQHRFWDTMSNTVEDRPSSVYVVIDEAHRGMAQRTHEAETIVQKFIKGDPGVGMPKVPIIVGVSATPKRFEELIEDTDRRARLVRVEPKEALRSGLLKESILLRHSLTPNDNEMTLLRSAARRFLMFEKAWRAHHQRSGGPLIKPIMLVQVEDAKQGRPSATDLAEARGVISDELGGVLASNAFAHAFQDAKTLNVNGTDLRGLAPADIDDDKDVKVVFFKTALNTGWDCPRAEVMMSFRVATDPTPITQLVGRMVRTPLRRRVEGPDRGLLNAVDLYLPKYDEKGLDAVVRSLTDEDQETHTPSKVVPVVDLSLNDRLPEAEECRALLGRLPTYRLDRRRRTSETARFMKIAGCLQRKPGFEPVVEDATEKARGALTRWLCDRLEEKRPGQHFQDALKRQNQVEVGVRRLAMSDLVAGPAAGSASFDPPHPDEVPEFEEIADRDLIRRIDRADRELGRGLARALVRVRERGIEDENSGTGNGAYRSAMLEVLALLESDPDLKRDLNERAGELIDEWKQRHARDIEALPNGERDDLKMLIFPADELVRRVEPTPPPEMIARRRGKSAQRWDKHLYAEADGQYFTYLNGWERTVLDEEFDRSDVVAWFRNQLGADQWRLAVPYYRGENAHLMYPDLIVFRRSEAGLVVDILDPHWLKDDAAAKVKGLADYAEEHAGAPLGRVEAIAVIDNRIRRLDLSDEQNRSAVRACNTSLEVRACLEGMNLTPGREAEQEPSKLRQDSGDEFEHESIME